MSKMKICLIEMDERTRQSISLVFKHRTNGAISVADEQDAEMAIIDLDREDSLKNYYAICERKPAFRAIGLSSMENMECGEIAVIRKPLSAGRLLDAVEKMSGRNLQIEETQPADVASSLSGRTRNSKHRPEDSAFSEGACFDPQAYLMGVILNAHEQAGRQEKIAVVRLQGDRVIILDPKSKMIQVNCSQARVLSLFKAGAKGENDSNPSDMSKFSGVEYMTREQVVEQFAGNTYGMSWEQLMWRLGWVTSQGRLPLGVDAEQRMYLRRWPNMTHLACTPDEMRIVAYWVRQPASLSEISEALDMPEQEVFSVYTSAYAAGLVGSARREVDTAWEAPEVTEHKERGLFSTIMKRLLQRKPSADVEIGTDEAIAA